ncbi:MAG: hypothetical protein Tsb0034_03380 [Ekhidna sp.]
MKSKILLLSLTLAAFFQSCENSNEKKVDSSAIVGTWQNESMSIQFLDSDSVFNVPKGQWEAILKIKPIITTYRSDSTFESRYYKLDGSPLFTSSGTWYLSGDSLFLTTNGATNAYHFSWENGNGKFVGILDWNEDGVNGERYEGIQVKIK